MQGNRSGRSASTCQGLSRRMTNDEARMTKEALSPNVEAPFSEFVISH